MSQNVIKLEGRGVKAAWQVSTTELGISQNFYGMKLMT
jgi:hypothetical protein